MKVFKSKFAKVAVIVALVIIFLPVVAYAVLAIFILPPKKLTPLVVNLVNEQIDAGARFECDNIELTFFSTYPHIGIRIDSGYMLSSVARDTTEDNYEYKGKDTLLTFSTCQVSFKPLDYLRKGEIGIDNIKLDDAQIYGYVNASGKANWDIVAASAQADTVAVAADTAKTVIPPVNLSRLQIKNAKLAYFDRTGHLYTSITGLNLDVKGNLVGDANFLDIIAEWQRFRFYSQSYSLQNTIALHLETRLKVSDNYSRFVFPDAKLLLNEIPFALKGEVFNNTESGNLDMDIEYGLNVPDIEKLLMFIPKKYLEGHNLKAKGEVSLAGTVKGTLGENTYPVVTSSCSIKDASIRSAKIDYAIEQLALDLDTKIDMADNKGTYVNLNKVLVKSEHFNLDVKAKLTNLLTNPFFNGSVKSDINFTELSKTLFTSDTLSMAGQLVANVEARLTLNDITSGNYGKVQATGDIDVSGFKMFSEPYKIDMSVTKANVAMTSERKIEKVADGARMLNGKIKVDSLHLVYADEVNTNLRNLYISLTTPTIPDTTSIVPVMGHISFDRMRTQLPDSVSLRAGKTDVKAWLMPSKTDKKSPVIQAIVDADSLVYLMRQVGTGALVTKSTFDMKLIPYVAQARRRPIGDTNIIRQRPAVQRDTTLKLSGASSDLFSKWQASGKLGFEKIRVWSAYFPVRMELKGSGLQFTSNDLTLSDTRLLLGKSDFLINGKITNIRRALLRGGRLSGELTTSSDYVDCDEIMEAIARGVSYGEKQTKLAETSFTSLDDIQQLTEIAANDSISGVFVLPAYLDLALTTKAKAVHYGYLELKNTNGHLVLHNQSVQITNLYSQSNVGQGGISMFYTARDKNSASLGLDIDMKGVLVDKFIDLAPSMDTLLPMLKSFEGVLDCQMLAICNLDSTSSVVLPSLEAACYLRGKDMVLLDGETFAEISKKLMFKNKKRNVIDSIAVDITVSKNDIEIYPFLIEIDRYRLAVGGTHNFDMSFNYHVSVLKSPVPFKLGVDVTGTVDNFDYKIVKCKYKDMFKSAKSGTIDTTRLNVRREIYHAIQQRIQNNLNNNYHGRRFSQMIESTLPSDSSHVSVAETLPESRPPYRNEEEEEEGEE